MPSLPNLLFALLILAAFIPRAFRRLEPTFAGEWADAHALRLTPANRPMVEYYLSTARKLRAVGVAAGLFLPLLTAAAFGLGGDLGGPLWLPVGYLVGATYAELALSRPLAAERAASLTPRRVTDYLPRRLLVAQRAIPLACLVSAGSALAIGVRRNVSGGWNGPSPTALVTAAVGAVLVALALDVVERYLVRRPQPVVAPDLLAADDAIRAQSLHSVCASGVSLLLVVLSFSATALATSEVAVLRWTMWVVAVLCLLAAVFSCLYYGHRAWRVPRHSSVTAPA